MSLTDDLTEASKSKICDAIVTPEFVEAFGKIAGVCSSFALVLIQEMDTLRKDLF